MLFKLLLALLFLVFVTNYIFNRNNKRKVRFTNDQVFHYHLSEQERNMKKKAYKRIRRQSKHYRQIDYLCYLMEDLKI